MLTLALLRTHHAYYSDSDADSLSSPTLSNFCHNKLSNLVLLAVLDNIVYAVGSVVYSFFFVKMAPGTWFRLDHARLTVIFTLLDIDNDDFRFAYPVIGSGVLGVVVSLWYVNGVHKFIAYVLTR